MPSHIAPKTNVVLRLQSGQYKIVQISPNTTITIPKYGSFSANLLLGRPYYFTYELQDQPSGGKRTTSKLRLVPAAELHAENLSNDGLTPAESRDEKVIDTPGEDSFDLIGDDGEVLIRNNRLTIDDPSRQALSMEEIEELKKAGTGSGKEIIAKIMAAHSALGEKTQFSLAKYTLRKTRKYMKRFTVLPVDVGVLAKIWAERDSSRILELREESLGLIMSWGNVHHCGKLDDEVVNEEGGLGEGRYLVIDDALGMVVAAMADRMGILYPRLTEDGANSNGTTKVEVAGGDLEMTDVPSPDQALLDAQDSLVQEENAMEESSHDAPSDTKPLQERLAAKRTAQSSAKSNTITILHANTQANISILESFGYDADKPDTAHPLYTHLRTLTWLQLLEPASDTLYQEPTPPEPVNGEEANLPLNKRLAAMKSGRRSTYWKKRKRWERVKTTVDETRAGEFDSLIVASTMDPVGILKHCVPLVRGGGNIVIYSPSVEPLTQVMDLYSRDRRAGYVKVHQKAEEEGRQPVVDEQDFPVDPTLLLNPMLQTARAREWQILPLRTHPVMTSRGSCEGYLFTATRVLPLKGQKVEAKGKFNKRRKVEIGAKGPEGRQTNAMMEGKSEGKLEGREEAQDYAKTSTEIDLADAQSGADVA